MLSVIVVDDCKSIVDALLDCLPDIDGVDTVISGSSLSDVLPIVSAIAQSNSLLLIVDYHLDGECGLDVISRLAATRMVPPFVIVMTGDNDQELTRQIRQTSYRIMLKPFSFDDLTSEIGFVLNRCDTMLVKSHA